MELSIDGGLEFIEKEKKEFLKNWEVKHTISSPYFVTSNGPAWLAVKSTKQLLMENIDANKNETHQMVTVSYNQKQVIIQILFGIPLQDTLPQPTY